MDEEGGKAEEEQEGTGQEEGREGESLLVLYDFVPHIISSAGAIMETLQSKHYSTFLSPHRGVDHRRSKVRQCSDGRFGHPIHTGCRNDETLVSVE